MSRGFIAIYRWRVDASDEEAFREHWRQVTEAALGHGSFGSLLARDQDGLLVGIALWPSEEARASAFAALPAGRPWPPSERISQDRLTVLSDLWRASPFSVEP